MCEGLGVKAVAACHANIVGWSTSRGMNLLKKAWMWSWTGGPGGDVAAFEKMLITYYRDAAKRMFDEVAAAKVVPVATITTTVTEAHALGSVKTTTTTVSGPK